MLSFQRSRKLRLCEIVGGVWTTVCRCGVVWEDAEAVRRGTACRAAGRVLRHLRVVPRVLLWRASRQRATAATEGGGRETTKERSSGQPRTVAVARSLCDRRASCLIFGIFTFSVFFYNLSYTYAYNFRWCPAVIAYTFWDLPTYCVPQKYSLVNDKPALPKFTWR